MIFHGIVLPWMRRIGAWAFFPALTVVAWGELTPHPPRLAGPFLWDKADHFTAYFGLALLASLGWGLRRSLVFIILGVIALGGALELLQAMVGRDAEWLDQLANTLGALTGAGLAIVYMAAPRRLVDARKPD